MVSRSWADIDLGAIVANAKALQAVAPSSELCAVVKANGYGHGAEAVARAAIDAGATRLAVAQVDEGLALREAGFDVPIWVLSEPLVGELASAAEVGLDVAVYSPEAIDAAATTPGLRLHLKIDTGMHRVGAAPQDAVALARRIELHPNLSLGSVWTHLASADIDGELAPQTGDGDGQTFTSRQLDRYEQVLADFETAGIEVPLRHAANSAGAIAHPRSHFDVIRCGIALYGLPPSLGLAPRVDLRPAMTWRTAVSFVKRLAAGDGVSYGQQQSVDVPTTIATIPVGYADGYRRSLWSTGGAVLIGGRRRPIVGVVTMDQLLVDCGDDDVSVGDEAVLIGNQGSATVTADDLATSLGTINYEIPVAVGARVARRYQS